MYTSCGFQSNFQIQSSLAADVTVNNEVATSSRTLYTLNVISHFIRTNTLTVTDTYKSFFELKNSRPKSLLLNHEDRKTSFLIFTPHGGGIEPGTTEICEWFNRNGFSFYSFTGRGKNCKELHITSTHFDEPTLIKYLAKHNRSISSMA